MPSPFFFPFLPFKKKKKATSSFWGRGDQKAQGKDFDPQVLPHNNTQTKKYNQNDQLCSNYCLRLGLEGTFTIALLCTFMYHRARQMRCAAFESREELGGIAGSEITRGWNFCLRVSLFSPPSKGGENTEESSFRWGMNPILFSATLSGRFVRDSKVGDAFEPRKMATERARWSLGKRAQRAQRAQHPQITSWRG